MKLYPLADKVVVKMIEAEESTKSGIILTTATKEQPQIAKVIAVGQGTNINGKEIEVPVKVNDQIVFNKYSGSEVKIDSNEFVIINSSDILAIVK